MGLVRALLIAVFLSAVNAWAGPFEDGLDAADRDDYKTALRLLGRLAEQGDAGAQFNLGLKYRSGEGVPKDDRRAVYWYRKAAEQGHSGAQHNLGVLYELGDGVPKDARQAVYWYRKAAEQGDMRTQYYLGEMYGRGDGVPKDARQAVYWYRKAAEQGYMSAQFNLGVSYATGNGVPKNYQSAYFWSLLASAQGHDTAARMRDDVEKMLAPRQVAAVQAEARDWKPRLVAPDQQESPERRPGAPQATATGSGFRVAPGRIVTNHHVVDGCANLRVNGSTLARVEAQDAQSDLALLSTSADHGASAPVRTTRPRLGEDVTVAGYPLEGLFSGLTVTAGSISRLSGIGGDSRVLQISAPVQQGNSGGPLLDASGSVVGVVVGKLDAFKVAGVTGDIPQNVNFAVNSTLLRAFLDSTGVDYQASAGGRTLSTAEVAVRAAGFTVLIECSK